MAYFNNAFNKTFLGTGSTLGAATVTRANGTTTTVATNGGYVTTNGIETYLLNQLPAQGTTYNNGYFGLFNADGATKDQTSALSNCCKVYLAGSTFYGNDKIGPFHGGYQETNKSKMINPRYVSKFYRVDSCEPTNNVIHVGATTFTIGGGVVTGSITTPGTAYAPNTTTPVEVSTVTATGTGTGLTLYVTIAAGVPTIVGIANAGQGYAVGDTVTILEADGTPTSGTAAVYTIETEVTAANGTGDCCKEFLCGENYNLRLDIKGSPALRLLNHNAYLTASYDTGCCPSDSLAPTPVDSTEVMIGWATQILNSPIVNPFVKIVVTDELGGLWYAPGTVGAANTWDNYVSPGHTTDACAGLTMFGAYVDTKFGDCTFQLSDFYEKEPVRLYASEVDLNGDPCEFTGICVVTECQGSQAQGFGETVLRDLILSESYRQNFFHSDFRIREITQGYDISNAIDRNALYTKYYLLHNVPRHNNPSGTFDNDQYLLEIITRGTLATFESDVNTWLQGCGTECAFEEFTCESSCTPVIAMTPAVR